MYHILAWVRINTLSAHPNNEHRTSGFAGFTSCTFHGEFADAEPRIFIHKNTVEHAKAHTYTHTDNKITLQYASTGSEIVNRRPEQQ